MQYKETGRSVTLVMDRTADRRTSDNSEAVRPRGPGLEGEMNRQLSGRLEHFGQMAATDYKLTGDTVDAYGLEFAEDKEPSFRGQEAPTDAVLITSAHNYMMDRMRKERRIRAHERPLRSPEILDWVLSKQSDGASPPTPEQEVMSDEGVREIHRAIDKLPPDQHVVVVRHCLQGETEEAIAESLCIKSGTVRMRLSRARESMAHWLGWE